MPNRRARRILLIATVIVVILALGATVPAAKAEPEPARGSCKDSLPEPLTLLYGHEEPCPAFYGRSIAMLSKR
jgi:hypothetical protein